MRRYLLLLIFVLCFCFTSGAEARKLALLVGVDDYAYFTPLKCCVNDMKTLKAALIKVGFNENDIFILTTGSPARDMPTKKNIERAVAEILSAAGTDDLVFFAFSGHGARDGETDYFYTQFAEPDNLKDTCVSITKVMDDLGKCKAKFKWMVVDACREDLTARIPRGLQLVPAPSSGIALFQSCSKGELSYEENRDGGNGYFTKNFAAALSGAADSNHDGKLTLWEVCAWTATQTRAEVEKEENKTQRPFLNLHAADFMLTEDLNVPKARALVEEARKAMDDEDYELAIEKFDEALALCPTFELWRRERNYAKRLLDTTPPKTTSRSSFEWDGTKITKFIGKETKVVIPEGTTEIGKSAFYGCEFLKSVVIPDGVTKIEWSAFRECRSLTSVVIPDSVTEIDAYVFQDCISLISVDIPDSVTAIWDGAFLGCISLQSINIPQGVTEIEQCMFDGCVSLKSVAIHNNVRRIHNAAFANCSSLKEWNISPRHRYLKTAGPGLLSIDGSVLIACPGAEGEYRIPEGVELIEAHAFSNCRYLTSVIIPESVTEIEDSVFRNCSSLTSVAIPEGISRIDWFVFQGCKSLTSVVIPTGVTEIGIGAFQDCSALKSIAIPDSVTKIEETAFCGCSSLKSVVIPDGVAIIDSSTFRGCKSLTSVVIPNSVSEILGSAFEECSSLKSVVIPEGVTKIKWSVFRGCSSLVSVNIPYSVSEIDSGVFTNCSALRQWSIPSDHPYYKSDDTCLMTKDGTKILACLSSAKEYRIPDGVREIASDAFYGCSSLTFIEIPDSLTEKFWIVQFENCPSLKEFSISPTHPCFKSDGPALLSKDGKELISCPGAEGEYRIPETVTKISGGAFSGCSALTSVIIPEGVKEISRVFKNCSSLRSVVIPDSLNEFGQAPFDNCPALKEWVISPNHPYFKSDGIALLSKDGKKLIACPGAEGEYRIPDSITVIYNYAFENNASLTAVVIPESVTEIGSYDFDGCTSLTSIFIPKSVKKIEGGAFNDCSDLTIYAPAGSMAEKYAKRRGIRFQAK